MAKKERVEIRVDELELAMWRGLAQKEGRTLAGWIRMRLGSGGSVGKVATQTEKPYRADPVLDESETQVRKPVVSALQGQIDQIQARKR